MKKKCMAIAKKVMVWSLAASMLVATPLTASAIGLNEVYKIEDNAGNVWGNEDVSRTGTVTSTSSKTRVLENEDKIAGIVLDKTDVDLFMNDGTDRNTEMLEVKILTNGDIPAKDMETLNRSFKWSSSNTQVVTVKNPQKDQKRTNKMLLQAKAGGNETVTVSLDNYDYDIHFRATVDVSVKEYAVSLDFKKEYIPEKANEKGELYRYGYVKHTVDLNEALEKNPETANEEFTFQITGGDKGVAAINKNGILSYKKVGTVKIAAVGERNTADLTITIEAGTPANKVEIWEQDKEGNATAKVTKKFLDVKEPDQREMKVVAKLYLRGESAPVANRNACTDNVTWKSNKPAIVEVKGNGDEVTLIPTGVGKASITAQASTGKKATLSVTVSATMTGIKITSVSDEIYAGQTVKLKADRYFGKDEKVVNFPGSDGVTWFLVDNATDKKFATIKKDVLTVKPAVEENKEIKVSVKSAKKYGTLKANVETESEPLVLTLKQADVQKIVVEEVNSDKDGNERATTVVGAPKIRGTKGTVIINAGNKKTLKVTAYDSENKTTLSNGKPLATTLNISANNDKFVTVECDEDGQPTVKAKDNKGKATITVSGTQNKNAGKADKAPSYKAIKASFKADVKTPAKTITLTYKQKVVKATLDGNKNTKKQTVKVTAALPKNTTTNAKNIKWRAFIGNEEITGSIKDGKTGSIVLPANSYKAGDIITVYASVKDIQDGTTDQAKVGATSTIEIPVVMPSKAVEIRNKNDLDDKNEPKVFNKNKAEIKVAEGLDITARVNVSTTKTTDFRDPYTEENKGKVAGVTYSVNKKGIVTIIDGKVKGIMPGTVKITATTSDGKKGSLTVKVVN